MIGIDDEEEGGPGASPATSLEGILAALAIIASGGQDGSSVPSSGATSTGESDQPRVGFSAPEYSDPTQKGPDGRRPIPEGLVNAMRRACWKGPIPRMVTDLDIIVIIGAIFEYYEHNGVLASAEAKRDQEIDDAVSDSRKKMLDDARDGLRQIEAAARYGLKPPVAQRPAAKAIDVSRWSRNGISRLDAAARGRGEGVEKSREIQASKGD